MQSRISCFNPTLFRKNLTRFWPIWGMASFIGVLCPLILFMQLQRGMDLTALEMREGYYSVIVYTVPLISLFYAVLCAVAVWSYLFNPRSVGLMHTLPIRRQGLFVTSFLSGMAMMLIPYAITGVVTVLVTAVFGAFDGLAILATVAAVAAESFFYFASATAVVFVTGNVFAMPVLYFIFHFLAVIADFAFSTLSSGFLFGLDRSYNGVVEWLSPTVYLMETVSVNTVYEDYQTPAGYFSSRLISVTLENWWLIAVYAAVGAVLAALGWLLYRRRRSESAGDVVAVGWMKPVFLWGLTFCSAMMGGQLLFALFFDGDDYTTLPMLIFMFIAGAIGYYAGRMLLAKSLRVFRRSWTGLAAVAVLSAALCLTLEADLLGIETRVPQSGEIEQVQVSVASNTYTLTPEKDEALLEKLRALHTAVAGDKDYIETFFESDYWEAHRYDINTEVSSYNGLRIVYTLRGGVTVTRQYALPLTRQRMAEQGTYDYLMNDFVNCQAAKTRRLHLDDDYGLEGADIWGLNRGNYSCSTTEAEALMKAVEQDMAEGTWGTYDFFEESDGDRLEAELGFSFLRMGENNRRYWDGITVYLRPEMTHTLALLEEMGLLSERDRLPLAVKYPDRYEDELVRKYSYLYGDATEGASAWDADIIGGADDPTTVVVAGVTA